MNDIASQPVMSMYSTDPGTGLTIISPRVYRLRQLQACDGVNISDLRLEQRGLAPITYMHHVSKIIEGNTESYRVRICRTCSGLPTLLELGSYTDVESALLVNDVHELMQDRTKQLHLLCVEDFKYFNSIAVRRRGSPHDLQITSVLQERLWKKSSAAFAIAKKLLKEAASNEAETGSGTVAVNPKKEQLTDTPDIREKAATSTGARTAAVPDSTNIKSASTQRQEKVQPVLNVETVIEKSKTPFSGRDSRSSTAQPSHRDVSRDYQESQPPLNAAIPSNTLDDLLYRTSPYDAAVEEGFQQPAQGARELYDSNSQAKAANDKSDCGFERGRGDAYDDDDENLSRAMSSIDQGTSPTDSFEGKLGVPPIPGEQGRAGIINRPSSQALSRAGRIVDQFKANLIRFHTTFIQWNFFDCTADIDKMFLALADFAGAELTHVISSASMRRNGSRGGGSADSAQAVAAAELRLREAWKVGRAPRSSLLSTIASVFPGNSMEMQMICKRVASVIAQDTPSVSRFNDLYAQAVDVLQRIESDVSSSSSRPFSTTSNLSDSDALTEDGIGSVIPVSDDGEATLSGRSAPVYCFKDSEEFIRQSYNAASYFDHSLRLCSWDGELSGVQEAEVKLHGIYSQLENRFIAVSQFLLVVTSANAAVVKAASSRKSFSDPLPSGKDKDSNRHHNMSSSSSTSDAPLKNAKDLDAVDETEDGIITEECVTDTESLSMRGKESGKSTSLQLSESGSIECDDFWIKTEDDIGASESCPQSQDLALVVEDSTILEIQLSTLLRKATSCVTYCILALTSAASMAWRLCGDTRSASSCIRACNNFLPILVENVSDPSILQEFIQRHLDLMTSIILYSGRSQMLGSGFGVLGPSNDGGMNFVFSRYRPAEFNSSGTSVYEQEEEGKESQSSHSPTGQTHTELRLLAFSLGEEIVKQSRRCFAIFPKHLAGPAAMVHFEAAFRAYVAIFLASLALEESDLLMKLGYTVERLLSATNDVLSSLQERINKQNCTLVSTHTLISLHAMAEACIFHSKRHVECANTVFMIVRSCRLLLWGCSPRFVLAKMLLEHIAAEESKRLFADDKEQATHLMTLKSAADQATSISVDIPLPDPVPYSSSVTSIFSPYDNQDIYGAAHTMASQSQECRADISPCEGQQIVGTSSKRYHTEVTDRSVTCPDAITTISASNPKRKRVTPTLGSSRGARSSTDTETKARLGQLAPSQSSNNILAASSLHQLQQSHMPPMRTAYESNLPSFMNTMDSNARKADYSFAMNDTNKFGPSYSSHSAQLCYPPPSLTLSSHAFGLPSWQHNDKHGMALSGSTPHMGHMSTAPEAGTGMGGESSWSVDGCSADDPAIYAASGFGQPLNMRSSAQFSEVFGATTALSDLHTNSSIMQHPDSKLRGDQQQQHQQQQQHHQHQQQQQQHLQHQQQHHHQQQWINQEDFLFQQ